MGDTIGDNQKTRDAILNMGRQKLSDEANSGNCPHAVLKHDGQQDLTGAPKIQKKCPHGLFLATCKECGTTKSYRPYIFQQL